jgi:hypothetical protein
MREHVASSSHFALQHFSDGERATSS